MAKAPAIEIRPDMFLKGRFEIPALPTLVDDIHQIMESPNASVADVADLVANDQTLAAQVLRVANSSYYSFPRVITDVRMAAGYIGVEEVYRLVLSLTVLNMLATDEKEEFGRLRKFSLLSAMCAKHLALRFEPLLPPGETWTAGLLHDIGRLVYLRFFPEQYHELTRVRKVRQGLFSDAETKCEFPKSSVLGGMLCDRWQLPPAVRDGCEHHDLEDLLEASGTDAKSSFRRVVSAAGLVSSLTSDTLNEETKEKIISAIRSTFDLSEDEFFLIMGEVTELREEVARLAG